MHMDAAGASLCMQGKTVVVTGASSGIGLHSAIALARQGACVIGVGRHAGRCQAALEELRAAVPGAQAHFLLADLALQGEVRRLAREVRAELRRTGAGCLDALVNNAGISTDRLVRTEDGVELTLAVNHLAPFLLTHELLPELRAAPQGRVVTVASRSHELARLDLKRLNHPWIYFGLAAYAQSKLCNLLFTAELRRREAGALRAFAVDPGLVNTHIGLKRSGGLSWLVWELRRRGGRPPEVPARTVLYLCAEGSMQAREDFYFRDCRPRSPSAAARDAALARGLWQASARLCGLPQD